MSQFEFGPAKAQLQDFEGASSVDDGVSGLVPAPSAGDEEKVLKGDGTWGDVEALPAVTSADNGKALGVVNGVWAASNNFAHNTDFVGATSSTAGTHGLVPAPAAGDEDKVLKGDGNWGNLVSVDADTFKSNTLPGIPSLFSGAYIWTDGENIYYSDSTRSAILNKSTSTWEAKTWNGIAQIWGNRIWTDGDNIYYSNSSNQYALDKNTSAWVEKTWSGLTSFNGEYIWTDGDNIYYSFNSNHYVLDKSTSTWNTKTWYGLGSFYFNGNNVWTDGDNIYFSSSSNQYVLDKLTSTWSQKTWSGFTYIYGSSIWKDGDNIYYSSNSRQYILDKSTSKWNTKTWSGLSISDGQYIWTDGDNIYYSDSKENYILNKSNSTWTIKSWENLLNVSGSDMWTDGDNIYYSDGAGINYVLDKSTFTWSVKVWNGYSLFYGAYTWTDGDNIYYSAFSKQYVLDKSTSTWNQKTWNGLTSFSRNAVWTDGDNIYASDSNGEYVLEKSTSTWNPKTWYGLTSLSSGIMVWRTDSDVFYSNGTDQYVLNKDTSTWVEKTWNGLTSFNGENIWTDGNKIYYSSSTNQYVLNEETSTWISKTWYGLTKFSGQEVWTDGEKYYYSNKMLQYVLTEGEKIVVYKDGELQSIPADDLTMKGATSSSAGESGFVPAPSAGDESLVLTAGGTWGESPGAKLVVATLTVTNTSGSYSNTVSDERITASMKPVCIEIGTPATFNSIISVTPGDGQYTISCSAVAGTSSVTISFQKVVEDPSAVTSSEFDLLNNRIGTLSNLTTTAKTNVVAAINEVDADKISTSDIANNLTTTTEGKVLDARQGKSLSDAIANVNSYSYVIPTTFDSTVLTEVKAARRGGVVSAYVTIKAGVAASTWYNGIVTGLPERFRPAADTYGTHRVNSSADLAKDMIITLHTSGQVQFLLGTTFNADIPCCFTFVAGAD